MPYLSQQNKQTSTEQAATEQIADSDRDKGGDKTGYLEGVIDDVFANRSGAGTVETDSRDLSRVIGQEEIAVDSREEGQQHLWRHTQRQAHRIEGLDRSHTQRPFGAHLLLICYLRDNRQQRVAANRRKTVLQTDIHNECRSSRF